jgi:hypothetical protein
LAIVLPLLACAGGGCFAGQGPMAERIRPDTNDRYYPQRDIHFVERGRRSKGVLVSATAGFNSAFSASWVTMLVPKSPTALPGPTWTGREAGRAQGAAIAALPAWRNSFYVGMYGDSTRLRFRESAVWILSTDPFIVALPAGEPKRSWRDFAKIATGVGDAKHASPVDPLLARYVVDEELDQPIARLVVFSPNFWKNPTNTQSVGDGDGDGDGDGGGVQLSVVTLRQPLSIDEALDALAAGDALRLGHAETAALHEPFRSERENAANRYADHERLQSR